MKNVISIVTTKASTLEFEVGIDGISPSKVEVRLCIKAKEYSLVFECKKGKKNLWNCDLPALEHLEKGAYPYSIEVIADGYHFIPMDGTANVSGSFDVYVKKAEKLAPGKVEAKKEKKAVAPTTKKETKKTVKKESVKEIKTDLLKTFASKKEPLQERAVTNKTATPKKTVTDKKANSNKGKIDDIAKKIFEESKEKVSSGKKKEIIAKKAVKEESKKEDLIHKIISETKDAKTNIKPIVAKKAEVTPIIKKTKKPVVEKEQKSKVDENVSEILKEMATKEKKVSKPSPLLKKGSRVIH